MKDKDILRAILLAISIVVCWPLIILFSVIIGPFYFGIKIIDWKIAGWIEYDKVWSKNCKSK